MTDPLSRRERQIMDIVYRRSRATAAEVQQDLPDPPSYSSVRTLLRILEEKGHLRHTQEGNRYFFEAAVSRDRARKSALMKMVDTFFEGSAEQVVAALIEEPGKLSKQELDRIGVLVRQASMKERRK